MLQKIMIDTHTHTVLSGHAWSTLRENAVAGAANGLAGICLTEHGYGLPGAGPWYLPGAQRMLPREIAGLRVYLGIEANIMDLGGGLDIEDRMLRGCEWVVASMHDICMNPGCKAENTEAFKQILANPAVDMLGHIDDVRTDCDFGEVAAEAKRLGKIIEINNNSITNRRGGRERVAAVAAECMRVGARVSISSDAHFDTMVGNVGLSLDILNGMAFPEELLVNRSLEVFEAYLEERRERLKK